MHALLDLILHFDAHLAELIAAYGPWVYALLFAIVFGETGLVVLPFLPGDSMLFVVGAFCAGGQLSLGLVLALLWTAAVSGNLVNFAIGRAVGHRVFAWQGGRLFNRQAFDRTHAFYERHGALAIVVTRFIPVMRSFAPFVAGVAEMSPVKFAAYNAVGGAAWVGALTLAGYLFGDLPWVRGRMGLVTIGIVVLSLLPLALGWLRARRAAA